MLRNAGGGGGGLRFSGKKRYEGVRFNVISITRGWVGVQFPGKKRYVTLEWPLTEPAILQLASTRTPGSAPVTIIKIAVLCSYNCVQQV